MSVRLDLSVACTGMSKERSQRNWTQHFSTCHNLKSSQIPSHTPSLTPSHPQSDPQPHPQSHPQSDPQPQAGPQPLSRPHSAPQPQLRSATAELQSEQEVIIDVDEEWAAQQAAVTGPEP